MGKCRGDIYRMMIYIYAYENLINGKLYIGQTHDLTKRDRSHIHGQKTVIDKAIRKYGRNNFALWTITIVDSQSLADQEESYWISEMRAHLGKHMIYNLANGGMCAGKHSEETKNKLRQIARKLSDDQVENIRIIYQEGQVMVKDLACIYNVDKKAIYDIVRNNTFPAKTTTPL